MQIYFYFIFVETSFFNENCKIMLLTDVMSLVVKILQGVEVSCRGQKLLFILIFCCSHGFNVTNKTNVCVHDEKPHSGAFVQF